MSHRFARYTAMTAAAAAVTAVLAFAQAGPARPFHHQAMLRQGFAKVAAELNLTDAQKEQAKTIFQQARQSAAPLREQLKQNHEAIAAAVKAGKSDTELQALGANAGNLAGQLIAIRAEAMSKVYAMLTPEQKQKADQLHEQIKNRIEQRLNQHPPAGE